MSTLTFTDAMARVQRAVAQCHDLVLRQRLVLEALQLRTGERVLEVGCGGGFYTSEVAYCVGPTGRVCAIDRSADQIAAALPYEAGAFDVVYGVQVFQYIEQLDTALREVQRVLRPGGRCAIVATDWSTAVWHSRHPERMRRVLAAWAAHTPPRSAVHPGGAVAAGWSGTAPADAAAPPEPVLPWTQLQLLGRPADSALCGGAAGGHGGGGRGVAPGARRPGAARGLLFLLDAYPD